jgi:hypothetical protein
VLSEEYRFEDEEEDIPLRPTVSQSVCPGIKLLPVYSKNYTKPKNTKYSVTGC